MDLGNPYILDAISEPYDKDKGVVGVCKSLQAL